MKSDASSGAPNDHSSSFQQVNAQLQPVQQIHQFQQHQQQQQQHLQSMQQQQQHQHQLQQQQSHFQQQQAFQNNFQAEMALNLSRQNNMSQPLQQPLLDSLNQTAPTATSTPNPTQQQQNILNQDLITNLLFKFDPSSFFPKKEQLSLIFNNNNNNNAQTAYKINEANKKPAQNQTQQQQQFLIAVSQPQMNFPAAPADNTQNIQQITSQQNHQINAHQTSLIHQANNQTNPTPQQQPQPQQPSAPVQSGFQFQEKEMLNESTDSSDNEGGGNGEGRPYKCGQCFKTFRKKVHLNQHCRIHSGEKPYGCEFCEKRFTQLSHLWQHRRRHTGERPYKCDIGTCDKSFTQLSNLQSHLRTHGNQSMSSSPPSTLQPQQQQQQTNPMLQQTMPHKCGKCLKAFNSKEELQSHVVSKHSGAGRNNNPNKRHYCELCRKRFATEGVITKHIYTHQANEALLVRNVDGSLVIKALNPKT